MRNYKETKSDCRSPEYAEYEIQFEPKEGDKDSVLLIIERCPDGCMPLWVKEKRFKEPFAWWHIRVYATENETGTCYGRYNPQEKPEIKRVGKSKVWVNHNIVNFEWVLPATEENRQKIIAEVSRLAFKE